MEIVVPIRRPGKPALQRLDDRVVPALQHGSRAVAHALGSPVRGMESWERRIASGRPARVLWKRRRAVLFSAVAVGFLGTLVHTERFTAMREAEAAERFADQQQDVRPPGEAPVALPGGAVTVGPTLGTDVEEYIADRHADLAAADAGEVRVAVVSFASYLTGEAAAALVPSGAEVLRVQLRIPDVTEAPIESEVVAGDLTGSVDRVLDQELARLVEEEAGIRELVDSGTVTDPTYRDFYNAELDRLVATRNLINSGSGVVFAVILRTEVSQLAPLTEAADVRLVDVAPGEIEPDTSAFYGLLPEDVVEVSRGEDA